LSDPVEQVPKYVIKDHNGQDEFIFSQVLFLHLPSPKNEVPGPYGEKS
jgi:hypothetical protein